MKLDETKEFFVLRKGDTGQFYSESGGTTENLLEAKLITDRNDVDDFEKLISQASISAERKTPILERIRIRITTKLL